MPLKTKLVTQVGEQLDAVGKGGRGLKVEISGAEVVFESQDQMGQRTRW